MRRGESKEKWWSDFYLKSWFGYDCAILIRQDSSEVVLFFSADRWKFIGLRRSRTDKESVKLMKQYDSHIGHLLQLYVGQLLEYHLEVRNKLSRNTKMWQMLTVHTADDLVGLHFVTHSVCFPLNGPQITLGTSFNNPFHSMRTTFSTLKMWSDKLGHLAYMQS